MNQQANSNRAMTLALYALVAGLAFLHVFITFPGITSAAGMDQAQLAREIARGNGYSTKVLRPHALRQMKDAGKLPSQLSTLPETYHLPLQPMLWAAVFTPLQEWWPFEQGRTIFMLDRIIAAVGVVWLLLTLLLAQDMARRLFDPNIGLLTLCALISSVYVWRLAISGSPLLPLLCFTTLTLHLLTLMTTREAQQTPVGSGLSLLFCLSAVAMVCTHWMAWPLLIGLIIGILLFIPTRRGTAVLLMVLLGAAVGAWGWRCYQLTGDPLGAAKALLLSLVGPESEYGVMRDYDRSAQVVFLEALLRKLSSNSLDQLQSLYTLLGGIIPALLFFLALLHRFRRTEVTQLRSVLCCMWGFATLAMCLIGLPEKEVDDNLLHLTLLPGLTMYGLAGVAVLWARLQPGRAGLWTSKGYAILLIGLTAWPMAMTLPTSLRMGLFRKNEHMNWPPYAPPRLARLTFYTAEKEMLVADAPWSVAWYADRTTLYLPKNLQQFELLNTLGRDTGLSVAGFVFSPWSTKDASLSTQLGGSFKDWNEPILRGPVMGIEVDIAKEWRTKFPYPVPYLLAGLPSSSGRVAPALVFYSDKPKRDMPKAEAAKP